MRRGARQDMMIGRVPSPALPDLRPALRLAGPARPLAGVQGRGAARPAARGRRAAPNQPAGTAGLGRPHGPGRPDPVPLGYSIACLTCAIGSRFVAVMVDWPGAAQDRLLASSPDTRPGCPGIP